MKTTFLRLPGRAAPLTALAFTTLVAALINPMLVVVPLAIAVAAVAVRLVNALFYAAAVGTGTICAHDAEVL
jgi:hypothetical protein